MTRALTLVLGALVFASPHAQAQDLFITHARIVDPAGEEVREANLLIVDGAIVGEVAAPPADFAGTTLDLAGKWVIPGLNDLHTHSYGNMAPGDAFDAPGTPIVAKRMLYAGVTGFLDLFGAEEALYTLRERQRSGEVGGAELFASLSCLTATGGHCTEYGIKTRVMDTPEDARREVADLSAKRPDVIKIVYSPTGRMPSIDKATLAAAVSEATARSIKTVIHINTWQDARDAVEVGASAITHVPGREPIPEDLAPLMAERGVYSIPTLAVETELADFVEDRSLLDSPLARSLTSDAIIEAYRTASMVQRVEERRDRTRQQTDMVLASTKEMADAGVTILTGTDSGNWGTIQGYSLHRELVKLIAAGLTPWQALAASTTKAGELLGRSYGVRPGDEANLVVLDASPIDDIRNTQRIAMVIQRGRVVDREQLLAISAGQR
jgi:imidazolonepropionase-like amidohydrolase